MQNDTLKHLKQNNPIGYIPFGITDHYIFTIQKNGIDVYDLKNLNYLKTLYIPIKTAEHTTTFNNNFYFIADNIIYRVDKDHKITQSNFFKNEKLHVKYIYPKNNGFYILSKLNETETIYFFKDDLKFENKFILPKLTYIQGSTIIDNQIWINTSKGSFVFNENGKLISSQLLFENLSISKIIKDKKDNYWFASVTDGIRIVPNLENQFYKISKNSLNKIIKKEDNFLIGTSNGEIIQSNNDFNSSKTIHKIRENVPTYYLYFDSISNNTIFSDKGFSLVRENKFDQSKNFDIALKEIVRLDDSYYAFASSNFVGLLKNPNAKKDSKSIWNSIFEKNQDVENNEIAVLLNNVRAKSISYDNNNQTLFFATNIGTFAFLNEKLFEIKLNKQPLYASKVFHIQNKNYAISTKGNLFEIDSDYKLQDLNQRLNIPDGGIEFAKNIQNKMYLVCNDVIYEYGENKLNKINLPVKTNLINDFYIDSNRLILLTSEGLLTINLNEQKQSNEYLFHIDKIYANNIPYDWKTKNKFDYNQNNINIAFSLLEYVNKSISIHYRINNEPWVLVDKNTRQLEFPSLAAGNYTLEFKIENTIYPEKINFEIVLPFWKKWWFYLIGSLFILSIAFAYFRFQSRLMKNKIKLLNEKIQLEKDLSKSVLTSIKSQMNPHFFYNALNTIQAYIFTNDKQKANYYLAKFSKLTRMILEMSEKETVSIQEEIQSIKLYLELEQMRFSDDFNYEIKISEEVLNSQIEFPPMLLQPYIENAIKHGLLHSKNKKTLIIEFNQTLNDLIISISDNGIGRKRASEINQLKQKNHQSFATNANEKRLEILNNGREEKISVKYIDKRENGKATGTTVILTIPLN